MGTWGQGPGEPTDGAQSPDSSREPARAAQADPDTHALFTLADTVVRSLGLDQVLDRVVREMERLFRARAVWIRLLDPATGRLAVRAARAPRAEPLLGVDLPSGRGLAWAAFESQQITCVPDIAREARVAHPQGFAAAGINEVIFVPLVAADRSIGVLVFCPATRGEAERPEQRLLAMLSLFAAHAAVAIQSAAARAEAVAARTRAEQTARRLGTIQRLEEAVALVADLPSLLGRAASLAAAALGGRHGAAALLDTADSERRITGQLVLGTATGVWADLPWRSLPLGRYADLLALLQAKRRALVLDRPGDDRRLGRLRRFLATAGVRQLILAPMLSSGRLVGALAIDDGGRAVGRDGGRTPFTHDDLGLAESLGARLGAAVDRIRLVESERRRSRELLALQRTTQQVASTLSVSAPLPVVVDEAVKLLDADGAVLRLRDGEELALAAQSARLVPLHVAARVPVEGSVSGLAVTRNDPVMIRDLAADPRTRERPLWRAGGFRSYLGVPIRMEGAVAGVLGLYSKRRRRFEPREAELAATLADVVAVALENARLFERVSLATREWETSFNAMADGIALVDAAGRIVRANEALVRLLGATAATLAGRPFGEIAPDLAPGREGIHQGRTLALSVSPLLDGEGRQVGAVHAVRDVTAERLLQQQLLQSEKLASIGQLISGIAHELNNPLAAIMGYAELLRRQADDPRLKRDVEQVRVQTERAARIVHNLLAFSRNHPPEAHRISLNDVVRAAVELQAYDLRVHDVEVDLALDAALPAVMADFHQFEEVVVNILVNARQAIRSVREDGRIRIESRALRVPDGSLVVRLTVRDNGPGIPREHLHRIFDPFFTTKAVGVGTGLGLSICFGVVEAHRGRIWAESEPGAGAAISVELPAAAPSEAPTAAPEAAGPAPDEAALEPAAPAYLAGEGPAREAPARAAASAGEAAEAVAAGRAAARILVVDDEPSIRDVVACMLEAEGFAVETAEDGVAATAHLAAEPFDLVIADVKMPGMDGLELADWIVSHRPALFERLVLMTGDTVGASTGRLLEGAGRPFIAKPFTRADLVGLVGATLDPSRAAVVP